MEFGWCGDANCAPVSGQTKRIPLLKNLSVSVGILSMMPSDTYKNNLSLSVAKTSTLSGRKVRVHKCLKWSFAACFVAADCIAVSQYWINLKNIPISHLDTKT